jgi:hypothetical protein
MARIQSILSDSEEALLDQAAEITRTSRSEVLRNALTVYHWFVRQAVTGAKVVARTARGEEVTLETPELAALQGPGQRLSPEELGALATRLAATDDPAEAARLRERMTRGFYGV